MLVLFGSAATGVKKPHDTDVAVFLSAEAKERTCASFDAQFEIVLHVSYFLNVAPDDIDAVFIGPEISSLFAYHIARDGKLLFGSERDFMKFRIYAVKAYQDAEKFREATRQYLRNVYA